MSSAASSNHGSSENVASIEPVTEMMKTTEHPLPEKERYTYEDYAQLPEGAPYQLVEGELAMTPSPTTYHQRLLRRLSWMLQQHISEDERGEIFFAPMDVYLSEETTLQPDLMYVARDRRGIIGEQKIEGAPDLIVEILSPSTAYLDLTKKKRLYEQHGVREYWIVDPEQQTVEVFENTDSGFMQRTRVVESGTAASTLLDDFTVDLDDLFQK